MPPDSGASPNLQPLQTAGSDEPAFFSRTKGNGEAGQTFGTVRTLGDPRIAAIPDVHGHSKGEHKPFAEERPIAYSARMLFLWFYHACRRGAPRFMMVADHINYLTFEDPGAVSTVRRALKLAEAGDLYGAAETAGVDVAHAAVVSEGLRKGMRFSIGAELDNDPRARPDAQNIVEAMRPDGMIRSVHFLTVEHPQKGPDWQWPLDNPEFAELYSVIGVQRVWELYVAKLVEDVEKLPGQIVAHFYAPAEFGHWPDRKSLERYEDHVLSACAARGMAIEINTRFLYREHPDDQKQRYRDANLRMMKKAKERGVGIAIGSGAHSPRDQGAAFEVVLKMLDEAKVNELVFPVNGRLARVALRATKEHLQKLKALEPAAQPGSSITGLGRAELGLPEVQEPTAQSVRGARRETADRRRAAAAARTARKHATAARTRESARKTAPSKSKAAKAARPARRKTATPKRAKKRAAPKPAVRKTSARKSAVRKSAARKPVRKAAARRTAVKKTAPKRKAVSSKRKLTTPKKTAKSKKAKAGKRR